MIKKIETYIIWVLLFGSCIVILAVMGATKICPDGNTDSEIIKFLIKNVTIQTVVEEDRWNVEYPFKEKRIETYLSKINQIKKSLNSFCTTSFVDAEKINCLVTKYKTEVMHYKIEDISSIQESVNYVASCIDNVMELQTEVHSMGIPFFYVQTPSQGSIDYYSGKRIEGGFIEDC